MPWAVGRSEGASWRWEEVDADGGFVIYERFEKTRMNKKREMELTS